MSARFQYRLQTLLDQKERKKEEAERALAASEKGADPCVDYAIAKINELEEFLKQRTDENADFSATVKRLTEIFAR